MCAARSGHRAKLRTVSFQPHQASGGTTPASRMKKLRCREVQRSPRDPVARTRQGGVSRTSVSYLNKPDVTQLLTYTHADKSHKFLPPQVRPPSRGHGPTQGLGSERHRKGEGGEGGDREKADVGWGPTCAASLCRVCATQVRGQKLSLFSHQLCGSRRQSPACPRPAPDSAQDGCSHSWALGLRQCAWGGWDRRGMPLPHVPLCPQGLGLTGTFPTIPAKRTLTGRGRHLLSFLLQPCWGPWLFPCRR